MAQVLLKDVAELFHALIGRFGQHAVAAGDEVYVQPYVYLSTHLVQMRAAGWDVDFDQVAAVSGASALFAYQPGEFMPKYAHLSIGLDDRIAETTGFGYEWVDFEGTEGAWALVVESVNVNESVKGWDWENILFAGYQDAAEATERKVYAMADGPDTYARWLTWAEFSEWTDRVGKWGASQLGRHTGRVPVKTEGEVARRMMADLIAWSTDPPDRVRERYAEATHGLAGIEAYAAACEGSDVSEDWVACHDINGQWTIRNATGIYLKRVAKAGLFAADVNAHLCAAAREYRAAYVSWQGMYEHYLGHGVPEEKRKTVKHRQAGAAAVRKGLAHEVAALAEVERALALLG
jgi:hypothetical protein